MWGKHPDHLGATTTTGGWSGALREILDSGGRLGAYPRGLEYLLQVNYTLEGVQGVLAKGGSARKAAAQAAAKSAGGRVESFYFALGSTDVYLIADLPDNAAAAALGVDGLGGRGGDRDNDRVGDS